ncbi:MAG: hypothetical protein ACRBHB_19415 [Arenicella sp.]
MIKLNGQFEGWIIDEEKGLLYDDGNNEYTIGDVRSIFYQRQLTNSVIGQDYQIKSLKSHLERKIADVACPTIEIDWGDGRKQIVKHPLFG